jgi:spore coat protein CotH
MAFLRQLGIPAPREAHTRLFINDEYAGVYTIVEPVDPVFLQRHFDESDGHLYAYEWVAPWAFDYRGPDSAKYSPAPLKPENDLIYLDPAPIVAMVQTINEARGDQFESAMSNTSI